MTVVSNFVSNSIKCQIISLTFKTKVMKKTNIVSCIVKALFRDVWLGVWETCYKIIISARKQISEAVYEEVKVILFSAPSVSQQHWSRAGFAVSATPAFDFQMCAIQMLFILPNFILSRYPWQSVVYYLSFNKAEQLDRDRNKRKEEIGLTG